MEVIFNTVQAGKFGFVIHVDIYFIEAPRPFNVRVPAFATFGEDASLSFEQLVIWNAKLDILDPFQLMARSGVR